MLDSTDAALRQRELDNDRAEREYRYAVEEAKFAAQDDICDSEKLREILNDECLAGPLARMCQNLELAIKEANKLDPLCRQSPCLEAVLQACSQMERELFLMRLEAIKEDL